MTTMPMRSKPKQDGSGPGETGSTTPSSVTVNSTLTEDEELVAKLAEARRKAAEQTSTVSLKTRTSLCIECENAEIVQEQCSPESESYFPVMCPACIEISKERAKADNAAFMAKIFAENIRQRYRNAGLDKDHSGEGRNLTLRSFWKDEEGKQKSKEKIAISKLESWVRGESAKPGIFMYGEPGLGKSHLAQSAIRMLVERRERARVLTFQDLLAEVQKTFNDETGWRTDEVLARFKGTDLKDGYKWLAIDDLGAADKPSDYSLRVMYDILNARLREKAPTIITSNYNLAELMKRILPKDQQGRAIGEEIEADRVIQRIVEMCEEVKLVGSSYRK
jgi:DNA replication protein DnaC